MSLINGNGAWDETFCCRSDQPALKRDLWCIAHTPAHTVHATTLFSPTGPSLASCWFHSSWTADDPAGWSINRAPLFTQISHSYSYFIQLLSNLNQTSFEFLLSAKSLVHLAIYSALLDSKMYVWYALQIFTFTFYIYAFSRRFYPKRLTLHSSYSFTFDQLLLSLGIEPMILALLAPCSTIWATGKLDMFLSEVERVRKYSTQVKVPLH